VISNLRNRIVGTYCLAYPIIPVPITPMRHTMSPL
jgi:hypothetical protein